MFARRLIHLVITSLFVALAVVPAAAAPTDTVITRTTSVFFFAYSEEAGISVSVLRYPGGGYEVCVSAPAGFGCTLVDEDAVQLDEKYLSTATLAPVTIPLERCDASGCGPVDAAVTVAVRFIGTGEITTSKLRSKFSNGCTEMGSSKGIRRAGDATITIDGTTYDATYAAAAFSRDMFKVQCR